MIAITHALARPRPSGIGTLGAPIADSVLPLGPRGGCAAPGRSETWPRSSRSISARWMRSSRCVVVATITVVPILFGESNDGAGAAPFPVDASVGSSAAEHRAGRSRPSMATRCCSPPYRGPAGAWRDRQGRKCQHLAHGLARSRSSTPRRSEARHCRIRRAGPGVNSWKTTPIPGGSPRRPRHGTMSSSNSRMWARLVEAEVSG